MHSNREHSTLGASYTSRWMRCPASVKNLEENPLPSSKAAADGTYTHEVAEQQLLKEFTGKLKGKKLACEADRQQRVDFYVNAVLDTSAKLADQYGEDNVEYAIEDRFGLGYLDDRLFGTNDAAVWVDMGELHIFDLKDGVGPVEAENNTQLMYYALGVIFKHQIDVNRVYLHIVQPKLDAHKTWEISSDTLIGFEHDLMKAVDYYDENPNLAVPGDTQCKWCNTATCPQRQEQLQVDAALSFPDDEELMIDIPSLTTGRLTQILKHQDAFKQLFSNIQETLQQRAMKGEDVEGYKLVRKLGNTTWLNPESIEEDLIKAGVSEDDLYAPRKVKSPTQLKKLADKKLVDKLSHRPDNGLSLVTNKSKGEPVTIGFEESITGLDN